MLRTGRQRGVGEHREILETVRMVAHDRGWVRRLTEAVQTGLTAEAAVERVQNDMRAKFGRAADTPLHERLRDLDDLHVFLARQLAHCVLDARVLAQADRLHRRLVQSCGREHGPSLLDAAVAGSVFRTQRIEAGIQIRRQHAFQ